MEFPPLTAYYANDKGTNHYYFQFSDCVVHINLDCAIINRLYVDHLRDNPRKLALVAIPTDDYLKAASEVLDRLGFAFFPTDPLSITRLN